MPDLLVLSLVHTIQEQLSTQPTDVTAAMHKLKSSQTHVIITAPTDVQPEAPPLEVPSPQFSLSSRPSPPTISWLPYARGPSRQPLVLRPLQPHF